MVIDKPDPEKTLLEYLRFDCKAPEAVVVRGSLLTRAPRSAVRLTGTKLGCGEGGCGACTVTVRHFSLEKNKVITRPVNACLAPLVVFDGMAITTVEGIGSTRTGLHSVQTAIATKHGSQCGFCTPGIVMSMYTLLQHNPSPTVAEVDAAFDGNLCRCTGYRPILEAFRGIRDPATRADSPIHQVPAVDLQTAARRCADTPLSVVGPRSLWFRPTSLDEMVAFMALHPGARVGAGHTELAVDAKFKGTQTPTLVSPTSVPELNTITEVDGVGLLVGGAVTLATVQTHLEQVCSEMPEPRTRGFRALLDNLRWFAGHQIRSVATLAGNIVWANPISDLNPVLAALGATLDLASTEGRRVAPVRTFFER